MNPRTHQPPVLVLAALALLATLGFLSSARSIPAQAADDPVAALAPSFEELAKPFLQQNCVACHNENLSMSGVRLDGLDASLSDRQLRLWEVVRKRVMDETMPPKGMPQPTGEARQHMAAWIETALDAARSRPTPKNGIVRRLTVSQYRNSLRDLLLLEDDLTDALPPDAVSADGFVNNADTLQLSPLLMEAYFEVADEALSRSIVDPDSKPVIQNFRVNLGAGVNPHPLTEELILGAGSQLLDLSDYAVEELTPSKPFPFEPLHMRTKYRFIEGYKGNATVRGWRDFDSIYHAVFADMRGSSGYPKGEPYATVPQGLLLRPAIPTDELFGIDSTYGPKANFKISLRELPDHGRFRITVNAAKYNDGLLLDPGVEPKSTAGADSIVITNPADTQTVDIKSGGLYQFDIYEAKRARPSAPDSSRLSKGLAGAWTFDGDPAGRLEGDAKLAESPFGQAVSLDGDGDALIIPGQDKMDVGSGDFTIAAWIKPAKLAPAALVLRGGFDQKPGWRFGLGGRGAFQLSTTGPDDEENGSVRSPARLIRPDVWQHIAAVVRRGGEKTWLYVNGYPVAFGNIGDVNLDAPGADLFIGRVSYALHYDGDIDEVHLYTRALDEAEIQALVQPGRAMALAPPETPQEITLDVGGRPFGGKLEQPAFVAVRLDAGPLELGLRHSGVQELERIVLTPLAATEPLAQRLIEFEKRMPRVGVHLGFRRDCGSTFSPVGPPQTVASDQLTSFVFEGAMSDFPNSEVEENNVNYLAGIREIAVRSEYTDGRDMPRLLVRSVEFEGPLYETWPPVTHQRIFSQFDRKADTQAYAREIIRSFATRAYRRPITQMEETALLAVFQRALDAGGSFQSSVKDALQVALTSPQFLFLVEASHTPRPEPLDGYELASKLSYFLWNAPPDEKTLALAAKGTLRQHLDGEVARLIADPRSAQFIDQFTSHWLALEKFDIVEPDRERFPDLSREIRSQLRREPVETLRYLIQNNLPVRQLIDSDYVIVNEVVASYYDLQGKTDSGFDFVPVAHGRRELGGVLTEAALMAGLSDGRESNPVKRGAWLARKIIAEPPDPPPPNVPDLSADTVGLSLRQRLEQHRSLPGCMQCHSKIDPWGVALEEFDAGGRLKQQPADAHSELPDGTAVDGINDLKHYLAHDRIDQVAFSVLKHLATYANGRSLTYNELNFLKQDALTLRASDYRMQDMIRHVVNSKLFLEK